ncbi:MAG TPA: glycerol-3-phosphate 1-O-acyltransferase PlsY [Gemmatimonadales bacterium]|nr:glycerol-3-phosphate 1-O-acyltransferase PlsY [Gemmatimonadales bacterium]
MSTVLAWLPWFAGAYLLGAVPTSYLVMRMARGVDLRTVGSGNLGATNLYRQLGWRYAVPVGLFDMAKGALPVMVGMRLPGGGTALALGLGAAAVLGHVYSLFVGFKGGKGVATGAGVVLGLAPWAFVVSLGVWGVVVWLSGYVSLASVIAAVLFPAVTWILHPEQRPLLWMHLALAALIVVLHRTNLRRLAAGTENRFGRHDHAASPGAG